MYYYNTPPLSISSYQLSRIVMSGSSDSKLIPT